MKLITKEIAARLKKHPLYSHDGEMFDAMVQVKFFDPCGRFTFLATEAEEQEDGDWHFFGYAVSAIHEDCDEFGYSVLSEMTKVRNRFHLGIERDLSVEGRTTVAHELKLLGILAA